MKKIIQTLVILVLLIFLVSCNNIDGNITKDLKENNDEQNNDEQDNNKQDNNNNPNVELKNYVISKNGLIPNCEKRNLDNKIIQIESKYCGHCKSVKPILEDLNNQNNLGIEFIDIAQDKNALQEFKINVVGTPTLIVNCSAKIGATSKENYEKLLLN